jgi:hypothetical protein
MNEVTCTMCAVNNLSQRIIFQDFENWKATVVDVWEAAQIRVGRSENAIAGLKREMVGNRGISPTLAIMYLREIEDLQVDSVHFKQADSVMNGILSVKCNGFGHCIAVKNGWIIDSIVNPGIYRWRGVIMGYKKTEIDACWSVQEK